MEISWKAGVAAGLGMLTVAAFLLGRDFEEKRLVARIPESQRTLPASATDTPAEEKYRELSFGDILKLPFAEFYEALRSAPAAAREKWSAELEKMPPNPKRAAAADAYYKLLVQFDPAAAAKAVSEIKDQRAQTTALLIVVAAAPASALPEMAKLGFGLPREAWPEYFSGFPRDLLAQWSEIDPAATALFLETLPDDQGSSYRFDIISNWAAIDPKAALTWAEKQGDLVQVAGEFFDGWYTYNRDAALGFALANATKEFPRKALPSLLQRLYQDSPTEAKKFLEQLPSDELRRDAIRILDSTDNIGALEATGQPELVPRTLGDWITQFPIDVWKDHLSGVFERWTGGSPSEVFAWIANQPEQKKSAVAAEYQKPLSMTFPEAAVAIFQFASPDLREPLLEAMFRNSPDTDEEMQKAISDSTLSLSQKEYFIRIAQRAAAAKEAERAEQSRRIRLQVEQENRVSEE